MPFIWPKNPKFAIQYQHLLMMTMIMMTFMCASFFHCNNKLCAHKIMRTWWIQIQKKTILIHRDYWTNVDSPSHHFIKFQWTNNDFSPNLTCALKKVFHQCSIKQSYIKHSLSIEASNVNIISLLTMLDFQIFLS